MSELHSMADVVDGARVLVVDADPIAAREIAIGLASSGLLVVTATSAKQAIDQVRAAQPDVAVVDLAVDETSIIRGLKHLHGESIHVIALAREDTSAIRQASLDAGCDDFVMRATSVDDLRMRVAIAARRLRAVIEARIARETAERQRAYSNEAVALLAHDLRNVMMACISTLTLASESAELDPALTDLMSSSLASLRLMGTLVANLIDVERFEDAAVKPRVALVDVRALLESVLVVHAASTGRAIGWEIDCDPSLRACFDPSLVERVLHNLVGNAQRYAGSPGFVRVRARRWFDVPPDSVEILVDNSGPLVPPEIVDKLFSKYGRGTDGKRGLGLYFCRLACEAHGGAIEYQAIEGKPTFVVRLPGTP